MLMLRPTLLLLLLVAGQAMAFCGFYVAGAGASLYNQSSEVILVRRGTRTVLTMRNDYRGEVRNFAMVIPVPTVLQRDQIRIAEPSLFARLDAYSQPRLVEYQDENPCEVWLDEYDYGGGDDYGSDEMGAAEAEEKTAKALGVKIEARYEVGEYSILILSGTESEGLATWLKANGYALPEKAARVLEPYVKNKLKFFVVKVNLDKQERQGFNALRPLQIKYESERFMLPIRLGMANANGPQDLIVYAFSAGGRIESANYRTQEVPTDYDVPLRVRDIYPQFYRALFTRIWHKTGRKSVFLEYAWDLDSDNYQMCDPCSGEPPAMADLTEAGVFWLEKQTDYGSSADYVGPLHFTRLHVRYTEEDFPEDLMFVETQNKETFQARYVLHLPATGDLSCDAGKEYLNKLKERNLQEELNLVALTGWKNGNPPTGTSDKNEFYGTGHGNEDDGAPPAWYLFPIAMGLLLVISVLPRLLARLEQRITG